MAAGDVRLIALDPEIEVQARLVGKPRLTPPQPRYETQQRPGRLSLVLYAGHDPYKLELPIKLDNRDRRSVEGKIDRLHDLAERKRWAGRFEPPIVRVAGQGIPRTYLRWRVEEIVEDTDRSLYRTHDAGEKDQRHLYVCTVRLVQRVADDPIPESRAVRGRGRGITNRRTTVQTGETSFYDVARRVYGDPSRAADIARANPGVGWLGSRLRKGTELRLP
jgi:hypothetical protein